MSMKEAKTRYLPNDQTWGKCTAQLHVFHHVYWGINSPLVTVYVMMKSSIESVLREKT